MKKLLTSVAVLTVCSFTANAQNAPASTAPQRPQSAQLDTMPVDMKMKAPTRGPARNQEMRMAEGRGTVAPGEIGHKPEMMGNRNSTEGSRGGATAGNRHEMMRNASPEQREEMKAKMGERKDAKQERHEERSERREMMKNLPDDKKAALKEEKNRHREAVKQIVGTQGQQ